MSAFSTDWFDLGLYFSSILLILGLKRLSAPKTARIGNLLAAVGLGLGAFLMLFYPLERSFNENYMYIATALVIGGVIGMMVANRVAMTAMPEMVSLFNGYGGICALLVSYIWILMYAYGPSSLPAGTVVALVNVVLGSVAATGSYIAYLKLRGKLKKFYIPQNAFLNIILLLAILALIIWTVYVDFLSIPFLTALLVLSLLYGVFFVVPIGGADMPVVISFLNSITGITAAIGGVITSNTFMLLGGILVGSSGSILTILMCRAMNRSLYNVFVGSFAAASNSSQMDDEEQVITQTSAADLAIMMAYARRIAILPGYGMAVAQAQKACKEIELLMVEKDIDFRYAIHPVAGRMPGHMNVLLAEANVPYDYLMDLEASNNFLKDADVALVVGANDVVNPAAIEDPSSSIYGMPILDLSAVKRVVVIKRSMNKGYAGIVNPLFCKENTDMLFGDAKNVLHDVAREIRSM